MRRIICSAKFEVRGDVIEVATRRYEMAEIKVTNELLRSYLKDLLTIQGIALDNEEFEITITEDKNKNQEDDKQWVFPD